MAAVSLQNEQGKAKGGRIMYRYDFVDMLGGILLIVLGAGVTFVACQYYPLGTLARMGPGMFPAGIGVVLSLFGVILALQAFRRSGDPVDLRIISPLFVLGGIALFAILVRPFGLIPALVALIFVSSLAELKPRLWQTAQLALGLCILAPLVFKLGLGLPIPLVEWPF